MTKEEDEAPSYINAADQIGAVLVRKVERGKSLEEAEARILVMLAILEQVERIASTVETIAEATQVQAQSVGGYLYRMAMKDEPAPPTPPAPAEESEDDAQPNDHA